MRKNIMGVYFHNVDMTQAVDIAMTAVRDKTTCRVVTPNAEIGMLCKRDDTLRRIMDEDFDAILMTYSCFDMLSLSKKYYKNLYKTH